MKLKYLFLLPALLISLLSFSQTSSNSLNFDNIDDHVVVSPTIPYTSTFTLEAWVNYSGSSAKIFGWGNNTINGYVDFSILNGKIRLGIGNGATFTIDQFDGSTALSPDTWYHVAVVKNGVSITMYLNGVQDGTFTSVNTPALITSSIIGAGLFNGIVQGFDSKSIDELRVWNIARSGADILANYNCAISSQSGLAASYRFNQGVAGGNNVTVTTLNDLSGNFRSGLLTNFELNGATSNWVASDIAAPTLNYRTVSSGVWNSPSIWETEIGSCWVPATTAPNSSSETITIRNGHNVSINTTVTANQLNIESGASLAVISVGQLQILDAPGIDLVIEGTLTVSSGNFIVFSDATASIEPSASLNFLQGNIGGEGTILVKSGASFNNVGINFKNYNGATTILNQGDFNWNPAAGNIFFDGGSVTLNNTGTFQISSSSLLSNNGNSSSTFNINNTGIIQKSASGTTVFGSGISITNDGNISLINGSLNFDNVAMVNNGTIDWNITTIWDVSNSVVEFNPGTNLIGNANLKVSGSIITINAEVEFPAGGSLDFNSGLLNGTGTLRLLNNSLITWNGGTFGGNLTTEIQNNATLFILGSVELTQVHSIQNFGTIAWSGNGNIDFPGDDIDASITNFNNFNFSSTGAIISSSGTLGGLTINNLAPGVITKSNGSTEIHPRVRFFNEEGSQLTVSSGTLDIRSTDTRFFGNIQVSNTGTLRGDQLIVFRGQFFNNSGLVNFPDVTFEGEFQQIISGPQEGNFNNLSINNPSGVRFDDDFIVIESLEFSNGRLESPTSKISTGIFTEIIGGSLNSYLIGTLARGFDINTTQFFPIGNPDGFAPLTVQAISPEEGLVVIARAIAGDHPDAANSPISTANSVNNHWNVNTSGSYESLTISFGYESSLLDAGANEIAFNVGQLNGVVWQSLVPSNISEGLVTVGNITSPQDFFIGEALIPSQGVALNFSGTDNYILGPVQLIPNNSNPYTVSVWARANTVIPGTSADIVSQGREFSIGYNTFGNIRIGDSWETGTLFPTDGLWHNYAVVRDNNFARLYIDGVNVSSTDFPLPNPGPGFEEPAPEFVIGAKWNGPSNENFQGDIDEVLVYNRLLCADEILSRLNCEQSFGLVGLTAAYNFNQGSVAGDNLAVTTLNDASGNGNNATLINFALTGANSNWIGTGGVITGLNCSGIEPVLVYRDADGDGFGNFNNSMWSNSICTTPFGYVTNSKDCNDNDQIINPNNLELCNGADDNCDGQIDNNNALNFDGVDDYVEIPEPALGSGEFTIEFWMRPESYPFDQMYLVANRTTESDNAGNWYRISMLQGGFIQAEFGLENQPSGLFLGSTSQLELNSWSHVALTRSNDNTVRIYINGVLENTANDFPRNFASLDGNAYIGQWQGLGIAAFDGSMDELRFWNVARTQNELRLNKIANLGNEPNLIRNYTFNQGTSNGENGTVFTLIDAVEGTNGFLDFFTLSSDISGSNWTNGFEGFVYADTDNDGFGDPNNSQSISSACAIPIGFVSDFSDCDDLNGDINPNGAEIQNGVDDNCNGQTDEGFSNCNISLTSTTGNQVIICTESGATTANVQLVVNNGLPPYSFGAQDSLNLTVGIYTFTVTDEAGCQASANIELVQANCIVPYYQPPANDTISNLIGAELTQLFFFPETFADTTVADNIFEIKQLQGEVLIEVIANVDQYDALLALLQTAEYGINNLIDNGDSTLIITGFYPIANLKKLDSLPELINYVRPYYAPIASSFANTGLTVTQGDKAMGADNAKNGWNMSGNGVKVGVLSDSYNTKAGDPAQLDVENGDLPGAINPNFSNPVNVLFDYPFGRASDEGRAMLQIIHDVAPNAELYFRSGFISAGNMAEGIKELQAAGCDVIVDDITYITEPYFLDGVVAQAVEEVSAAGVNYVTSAGNFGVKSYEGVFTATTAPSGYAGVAHDFGGGDVFQSISLEPGTFTIALQWEDGFYSLGQTTGTRNDLDIYLVDQFGNRLFGFNRNNLDGDPLEILPFVVRADVNANLIITRKGGNEAVKFKYIIFRGSATINEFNQGSATIMGQANAESAMTIGAVLYTNTPAFGVEQPTVASFSSRGGLEINGVDRQKPDFCGPNGVNTTVNLGGVNLEDDLFPNFFGTSAAAPHVAAVAALILEAKQTFQGEVLNGAQMKALIKENLTDMGGDDDYDVATGNGYIEVDKVLSSFSNPQPTAESLEIVDPTAVVGEEPIEVIVKGHFFDENASIVFQYENLDAQFLNDSTLIVQIPPFVGNPPLTVVNAALTNSGLDGGVSDSLYFFGTIPQNVVVQVNNAVKRFGEQIPAYEVEVTVNGTPLASTGLSMSDLGLSDLTFTSSANAFSNVGLYFRRANSSVTDLSLPESQALAEFYNYQFVDGVLTIERMPITVTPKDTTLEYGESIDGKAIQFQYDFITENIDPSSLSSFVDSLKATHQSTMSSTVIVAEGKTLADGRSLTAADLENLSFFASGQVEANRLSTGSGRRIVNGIEFDTTQYVSLAPEAIFDLQTDEVNLSIYNALSAGSGRRIVNILATGSGRRIVNALAAGSGRRIVNGETFVNGTPIVNGLSTGSGRRIVNSNTFNENSNEGAILLLDSLDTVNDGVSPDSVSGYTSMNLITGVSVGQWVIAPGVLMSENFDISYGLGTLNITPMQLYVRAEDKVKGCTDSTIEFTSVKEFYQYEFVDSTVVSSGPDYTILNQLGEPVSIDALSPGTYQIIPSNLVQLDSIPNYIPVYEPGLLIVESGVTAQATAGTITCFGGTTTVEVTASGGTAPYSGTGTFTVSAGDYSFTVTDAIGCSSIASGNITQPASLPAEPSGLACWQDAIFNEATCSWDVTGTQPAQPTGLACWQNANFNTTSCSWDVTGTQPAQPTGLACWQSANFNTTSCAWDVTGTQPAQPTGLACWQSANFNTTSCAWVVTGTQPAQPPGLACWQNAAFNDSTCNWDVTGTQPAQPTGLACWQNTNFIATSCSWVVTGTQPAQPTGLACWQNAAFNDSTCNWDVTGTQPAQPTNLACWQSANFNTTSCAWDVTGTQPTQPTGLACWQSANFNTTSCAWDVTGTQPAQPTGLACWQSANFNTTSCAWVVTGTQPAQPTGLACWQSANFNTTSCTWVVTGTPAPAIIANVTVCSPFTWSINNQVYNLTGTYNFTVNCQEYRLNLVVTAQVSVTGTIAGPTNACPHQGTSGTLATYTVQASNASNFVWTIPSGSTNVTGQGTATISFKFPSTFNSGTVGVTVGGCGTSIQRSISVTRSAPTTPLAISGPTNLCAFRGTNTQVNYSIASVANASSYTWTIPSGITLVSGSGTTSIQVLVGSSFCGGTLRVRANSACGNSSTRELSLNASTPSTPANIAGASKACPGEIVVYSVASVSNATSYLWSVPSGTTIVSGLGTNTISLSFGNSFNSGTLSVRAVNGCGQSSTSCLTLGRNAPAIPASISGPTNNLCGGGSFNYSVSPVAGATSYIWTVPSGCNITSNNGTNITVSIPSNFNSGSITVKAVNSCGIGTARSLSLSRLPSTPSSISGPTTFCRNQQNVVYTTPLVQGLTYTWTVPSGATITSGQGTASITVKFGTSNGSVKVRASNNCGTSSTRSLSVCAVSCRMGQDVPDGSEPIELVNETEPIVYPNPGNGQLNISGIKQNSVIQIFTTTGQLVRNVVVQSQDETLQINLDNEANGLYLIRIDHAEGQRELRYVKQ